jgi:hypothetical protein
MLREHNISNFFRGHNISNDPGIYGGLLLTGLNLTPGFVNEISVTRTFINKLGLPYNNFHLILIFSKT